MCVLSNIFSTATRRWLVLLLLSLAALSIRAEDSVFAIRPLQQTTVRRPIWDVYLFCNRGIQYNSRLKLANDVGYGQHKVFGNYVSLGLTAGSKFWRVLNIDYSLGYKYEAYAQNRSLFSSSAVQTHWLTQDVQFSAFYACLGFKSDVLLGGRTKSQNGYDLVGLNKDCFNRVSAACYLGAVAKFSNLKVQVIGGVQVASKLNANRIAYYNMTSTETGRMFVEMTLSYRIFTTGNRQQPQSQLIDPR